MDLRWTLLLADLFASLEVMFLLASLSRHYTSRTALDCISFNAVFNELKHGLDLSKLFAGLRKCCNFK